MSVSHWFSYILAIKFIAWVLNFMAVAIFHLFVLLKIIFHPYKYIYAYFTHILLGPMYCLILWRIRSKFFANCPFIFSFWPNEKSDFATLSKVKALLWTPVGKIKITFLADAIIPKWIFWVWIILALIAKYINQVLR